MKKQTIYAVVLLLVVGMFGLPFVSSAALLTPSQATSSERVVAISLDTATPAGGQIVMGSTGNLLGVFRFTAATSSENIKIIQLPIYDVISSNSNASPSMSDLNDLTLWEGATELGTAGALMPVKSSTEEYLFSLDTPILVPQGGSIALSVKGDIIPYSAGGIDDQVNILHIVPAGIVAVGQTSGTVAKVTGSAVAKPQTALRSTLAFAAAPLGATSGRGKVSTDQLAVLSFSANTAGSIAINKVNVAFSGSAVSSSSLTHANAVRLLDENNIPVGTGVATKTAKGVVWSFNFGSRTNGYPMAAGTTSNWTLVVNDSDLAVAARQNSVSLVATINSDGGVTYTDGLSLSSTPNLMLPQSVIFPILLNSVIFAKGI